MNKLFLSFFIFCVSLSLQANTPQKLNLNQNWVFRQYNLGEWLPACVPGTIHTDLLNNGQTPDPFYRVNEKDLQWIDKINWEYKTTFHLNDTLEKKKQKRLTFSGLDTYADIYLNGQKLGHTDNMFRTWSYDISSLLKKGDNELRIIFFSPVRKGLEAMENYGLKLPAGNDQSVLGGMGMNQVSVFTRKAPYHYGWDWGPRLVTSGIWRDVILEAWDDLKIEDIFIHQLKVNKKAAQLNAEITLNTSDPHEVCVEILYNNKTISQQNLRLKNGINHIGLPINIRKPRLWWSNGLGKPELYTFQVNVKSKDSLLDSRQITTGLRTLRLIRKKDKAGETFYFELNGIPVFAKGANYIPNDVFLPRINRADYEKVIANAQTAHMNMLRIWGGGIYEDDYFYELCDKNGIMVWQDFMFACSMYPGNAEFLENVRQEAKDNLIRLRNHPCIALWCGNNEIGGAWHHGSPGGWGWKKQFTPAEQDTLFQAYTTIFHQILPDAVAKYSTNSPYWASSPMAGPDKFDFEIQPGNSGDNHYWGVWHGKHRLEEYANYVGRFMSEYGFQSFPEFATVQKYALPEDYNIESDVMTSHQRSGIGNLRIREYMGWYYTVPEDFEQFLYTSQVLQARAMKTALQAHRQAMPYCMGSLVWQLNDCWPVASWSTTDYYHQWKAAHYAIRETCKPTILIPRQIKPTELEIWVVNDLLQKIKGTYSIELFDFDGQQFYSRKDRFLIEGNISSKIASFHTEDLLKGKEKTQVVAVLKICQGKTILDEQYFYFTEPKNLELPKQPHITTQLFEKNGKKYLTVTTDKLACNVLFYSPDASVTFSNNYIDLLPGRTYILELRTAAEHYTIKTRFIQ